MTGSVHCVFMFGPVGPLFGPLSFWPQRPVNASHAYGAVADAGAAGRRTTVVCVFVEGPRVSSQPNPSCALAPSQRVCLKKFACEPAAAYTTGCVPCFSSFVSSHAARSAPECWEYPTSVGDVFSASAAEPASNISWIISQSDSCLLLKSLNG